MALKNPCDILIVDDDPNYGKIYSRYLERSQRTTFNVRIAESVADGLALCEQRLPDCILLDYCIGSVSGLEFAKQLFGQDLRFAVPIVMVSEHGDELVASEAISIGIQEYITKAIVSEETLCAKIESAMKKSAVLDEVKEYKIKLEQSNKELKQFAHTVAHDLKDPLSAIEGMSNLLIESIEEPDNLELLQGIRDSSRQMKHLINGLLELAESGFRNLDIKSVDLSQMFKMIVDNLSSKLQECSGEVLLNVSGTIQADAVCLQQVFQNLLSNAIKYRKESESLKIEVSSQTLEDGSVLVSVKDNGIGFDQSHAESVFEAFHRIKEHQESFQGTGIGLATCQKNMQRLGGSIRVQSEEGKGSEFLLTFPCPA